MCLFTSRYLHVTLGGIRSIHQRFIGGPLNWQTTLGQDKKKKFFKKISRQTCDDEQSGISRVALSKQKIATLKSKPTEKHLVGCQWNKSPNALTLAKKVLCYHERVPLIVFQKKMNRQPLNLSIRDILEVPSLKVFCHTIYYVQDII